MIPFLLLRASRKTAALSSAADIDLLHSGLPQSLPVHSPVGRPRAAAGINCPNPAQELVKSQGRYWEDVLTPSEAERPHRET